MSRVLRKQVFGHMRKVKAQIIAVRSRLSLSANRIIGYYRMYEWRAKARMILCARAGWYESTHFAHDRRHIFAWRCPYEFIKEGTIQIYGIQFVCKNMYAYIWLIDKYHNSFAKRKGPGLFGPRNAKTCLRAYADREGPDQPAHLRSEIRTFTIRI